MSCEEIRDWMGAASATTQAAVWDTRVFRTALMALTEPRTLGRRITRYPSPRRRVALHSISKVYFGHWSERMWSLNIDASISGVSDPSRAFLPAFTVTGSADDMSGSTSNHSHVFSLYSHLCIYVSMYLYSYPSTQAISGLTAGGAWEKFEVRLEMTIEWTQRYTPRPWSSKSRDALGDWDRVNSEIHLEARIERLWRCIWRLRLSELRDAFGGGNRASLEMHLEAMIVRTCRP